MKIQEYFLSSFPLFHLLLHWARQLFLGIPPFISDPGSHCLFLYLLLYTCVGGPLLLHLEGHRGAVSGLVCWVSGSDCLSLLSCSHDGTLKTWDLEHGGVGQTLRGHQSSVSCVAVSPNGAIAVSGSADQTIRYC